MQANYNFQNHTRCQQSFGRWHWHAKASIYIHLRKVNEGICLMETENRAALCNF